jgi:outer membrane cobalamin receptor
LKAERSVSYEFGVSHSFGGNYWTDVALFQTDLDDLIEAGVDPERIVIRFENVTRARIRGLEVGGRAYWFDGLLGTNIGYTYVDPRDRSSNSVLRFRPRHLLYGSLTTSLEPIRLALEGRYISRVEAIDQRLVDLAPIVDGDARVDIKVVDVRSQVGLVDWGIPLVVDLAVTNVFNYHYVELIGNLAPVRTFHVGVRGAL